MTVAFMHRHAAFAYTASEKMRGYLDHGGRYLDAWIQSRQHEGLRAATRTPGHADLLRVHIGPGQQVVQHPFAVIGLQYECYGHTV